MAVNITVDPDVTLLCLGVILEELLHIVNFRLELGVRIDPLAV